MRIPKTLLITGGCGFIGSNFIRTLRSLTIQNPLIIINCDVMSYASSSRLNQELANDPHYIFYQVDVADREKMQQIIERHDQIDTIVHFAAETHVDRSIVNSSPFLHSNINGTVCLLEIVKEIKSRGQSILFHHISTDEVFGSMKGSDFATEMSPYAPKNPYSASKAASDHFVFAYANTYGIDYTLSYASNNYGPYQNEEKLIPKTILNLYHGKEITLYGDGQQERNWIYVEDHCRAIFKIITHAPLKESYCIGGRDILKNETIVHAIERILKEIYPDRDLGTITYGKDRPGHDRRYALSSEKIERELGFFAQLSLLDGLKRTIEYYTTYTHQENETNTQSPSMGQEITTRR